MTTLQTSAMTFVGELEGLQTVEALCAAFERFIRELNFDFYIISGIPGPFDELKDVILLHNLPRGWVERYLGNNFVADDPIVAHCFTALEPFAWSVAEKAHAKNPRAMRIMQEARAFGIVNGFCVPVHGVNGYEAGISISGARANITQQVMQVMHMVSLYTFNRAKILLAHSFIAVAKLTRRESEVLTWSALGQTASEIATTNEHIFCFTRRSRK